MEWSEYRIWYGTYLDRRKLYNLRSSIMVILNNYGIRDFLILTEPEFILIRIQIVDNIKSNIEKALKEIIERSESSFSKITLDKWSPEEDARGRILGAAQRLGLKLEGGKGWAIAGRETLNRHWISVEYDLELKVKEFTIFMTNVVGQFTRAYVEQMPRQIEDRWLLSVFVHLLLNSISLKKIQENEIRDFPYV